jgi:hypothetical protein
LNPDLLERPLPKETTIPNAIQGHATGEAKVFESRLLMRCPGHPQHDLLANDLYGTRKIHLALGKLRFRNTWESSE